MSTDKVSGDPDVIHTYEDVMMGSPNLPSVDSPNTSSSKAKITVLGVENARRRLKAFSIQKKQSSVIGQASPSKPTGLANSKVVVGNKTGHLKELPVPSQEADGNDKKRKKKKKKESMYDHMVKNLNELKQLEDVQRKNYENKLKVMLESMNMSPSEKLRFLKSYENEMMSTLPSNAETSKLFETLRRGLEEQAAKIKTDLEISVLLSHNSRTLSDEGNTTKSTSRADSGLGIISEVYSPAMSSHSNSPDNSNDPSEKDSKKNILIMDNLMKSNSDIDKIIPNIELPLVAPAVNVDKFGFLIRDTSNIQLPPVKIEPKDSGGGSHRHKDKRDFVDSHSKDRRSRHTRYGRDHSRNDYSRTYGDRGLRYRQHRDDKRRNRRNSSRSKRNSESHRRKDEKGTKSRRSPDKSKSKPAVKDVDAKKTEKTSSARDVEASKKPTLVLPTNIPVEESQTTQGAPIPPPEINNDEPEDLLQLSEPVFDDSRWKTIESVNVVEIKNVLTNEERERLKNLEDYGNRKYASEWENSQSPDFCIMSQWEGSSTPELKQTEETLSQFEVRLDNKTEDSNRSFGCEDKTVSNNLVDTSEQGKNYQSDVVHSTAESWLEPVSMDGSVESKTMHSVDESDSLWRDVVEACGPYHHINEKCFRKTKFDPVISYCENLNCCDCRVLIKDKHEKLSQNADGIKPLLSSALPEQNDCAETSRSWYPDVRNALSVPPKFDRVKDEDSLSYGDTFKYDNNHSRSNSSQESSQNSSERIKRNDKTKIESKSKAAKIVSEDDLTTKGVVIDAVQDASQVLFPILDISVIPTPPDDPPKLPVAESSLDLEYEKFMEAVYTEVSSDKIDPQNLSNQTGKEELIMANTTPDISSIKASDDVQLSKSKKLDINTIPTVENNVASDAANKEQSLDVSDIMENIMATKKSKSVIKKKKKSDQKSSKSELKQRKKEKTLSKKKKKVALAKKRKLKKKLSKHKKKRSSSTSSSESSSSSDSSDDCSSSSSESSSSSSESSTSSSEISDEDDSRRKKKKLRNKKKKALKAMQKAKKKKIKKANKKSKDKEKTAKESKKYRKQDNGKIKKKDKKSLVAEKKSKDIAVEDEKIVKKDTEGYSSDEEEMQKAILASKMRNVKKLKKKKRSKDKSDKAIKKKDRSKKKRTDDSSSTSSSSETSSSSTTSSSASSSTSGESSEDEKESKKRKLKRKQERETEDEKRKSKKKKKNNSEETTGFDPETLMNIKQERMSDEDESTEAKNAQFSPRIQRNLLPEIISVNELHNDFVQSNKNYENVVVKTEKDVESYNREKIGESFETTRGPNVTKDVRENGDSVSGPCTIISDDNVSGSLDSVTKVNSSSEKIAAKGDIEITNIVSQEPKIGESANVPKPNVEESSDTSASSVRSAPSVQNNSDNTVDSNRSYSNEYDNVKYTSEDFTAPKIARPFENIGKKAVSPPKNSASDTTTQNANISDIVKKHIIVYADPTKEIIQSPVKKPKYTGKQLPIQNSQEDIEHNRRVEELDRLKMEFEQFMQQKIRNNNSDSEKQAAAEELKRQFDMVESYTLSSKSAPAVPQPKKTEVQPPMMDIRPIPTVTGMMSSGGISSMGSSSNTSEEGLLQGEIKWDWRPSNSTSSVNSTTSRRPSRWGVVPKEAQNNTALMEASTNVGDKITSQMNIVSSMFHDEPSGHHEHMDILSDREMMLMHAQYEHIYNPQDDSNAVYKITTISSTEAVTRSDHEAKYEMYSEAQEMGYVAMPSSESLDDDKRGKKISLDERINLVLQNTANAASGASAVSSEMQDAPPSPPQLPPSLALRAPPPIQSKGILVLGSVKIAHLDPRSNIKCKKVCFSDGLAPGMDSDLEDSAEPISKKAKSVSKKARKKCGGHAYPCPANWPDYHPYYDTLPPPPPPPGSPPLSLTETHPNTTIMNVSDAIITRLPRIPSHNETQLVK